MSALQERIQQKSDRDILDILNNKDDYPEQVFTLAQAEAQNRNLTLSEAVDPGGAPVEDEFAELDPRLAKVARKMAAEYATPDETKLMAWVTKQFSREVADLSPKVELVGNEIMTGKLMPVGIEGFSRPDAVQLLHFKQGEDRFWAAIPWIGDRLLPVEFFSIARGGIPQGASFEEGSVSDRWVSSGKQKDKAYFNFLSRTGKMLTRKVVWDWKSGLGKQPIPWAWQLTPVDRNSFYIGQIVPIVKRKLEKQRAFRAFVEMRNTFAQRVQQHTFPGGRLDPVAPGLGIGLLPGLVGSAENSASSESSNPPGQESRQTGEQVSGESGIDSAAFYGDLAGKTAKRTRGKAIRAIVIGGIVCVAGIIATQNSTRLWWGAIVFGGLYFASGLLQLLNGYMDD